MADSKLVVMLKLDGTDLGKGISRAQADIAKIGTAFTGAGLAAGAAVKFAAEFQDTTIKAARAAGMASQNFSSLAYAAGLGGVNTEQFGKALVKLQSPSDDAVRVFKDMGIQAKMANGQFKDQESLLLEMADKFAGITDPASKSQAALRIFGEEGVKMVSMLESGRTGLAAARKEAEEFGQTVSEKAGKNAETFNDNLAKAAMGVSGFRNVVSESVIDLVNQSGALEAVQNALKGAIAWWRGLSETTQQTIIYIAGAAVAFGGLLLGLSAIAAIIPALAAGFAILTGPVGIVIAAIAGLAAAVSYLSDTRSSAMKAAQEEEAQAHKNAQAFRENEQSLVNLAAKNKLNASDETQLAQIKQDLAKRALSLGQAIDVESMSLQQLINKTRELKELEKAKEKEAILKQINDLSPAYGALIKNIDALRKQQAGLQEEMAAGRAGAKAPVFLTDINNQLSHAGEELKAMEKRLGPLGSRLQALTAEAGVTVTGVGKIRFSKEKVLAPMDDLNSALAKFSARNAATMEAEAEQVKKYQTTYTDELAKIRKALAFAGLAESLAKTVGAVVAPFSQLTDTIAKGIEYDSQVALRDLDVVSQRAAETYAAQKEAMEAEETAKIKALEDSYDKQIAAVKAGEDAKTQAAQFAADQRLLAADEEYRKQLDALNAAFAAQMEADRLNYEMKMAELDLRAIDREQRQLTETIMEEDARLLKEQRESAHEKALADLAKNYADKKKGIDDDLKGTEKANSEKNKAEIEALTNAKNLALEAAEAEKNAKLKKLDEDRAAQEKALEKQRLETQYKAQMDAFNATKGIKIAETAASGAAAAAQAFVSMTAANPWGLGEILGGIVAATIMGVTTLRISQINSQQPIKPAGLLEDGGFIGGSGRHMNGTDYAARVESGELYIDRGRSAKMLRAIDNGIAGGGGIQITFQAGAIQGDIRDERTMNMLAVRLGNLIQRQMVTA